MKISGTKSISEQIKRVARERGGTYAEVFTEFLIERVAMRLVADKFLYERLVFKGGFVGLKVYRSPRFTTDLDAVIHYKDQEKILSRARHAMAADLGDDVWFRFEEEIDLETQNEYGGIRLQFRGGLGDPPKDLRRAQIINIDLGSGDPITPVAREEKTETTLGTGELSWRVYPVETIIAEKLHPFANLGAANSRSKDLFDLAFYLPNAKPEILKQAIAKTFRHRDTIPPERMSDFIEGVDMALLRRGWRNAVVSIRPVPDFDDTVTTVVAMLKALGL